jgi:hypothetical protein
MSCSVILINSIPDKKIKSIGNRCLIPIKKNKNVLDYHISSINKIFTNPEIFVVCAFDVKKTKLYIEKNYKSIKYLEHTIDEYTNFGLSLDLALKHISKNSCLILNTNHILHRSAIAKIKNNLNQSFVLYNTKNSDVGLLENKGSLKHCYYGIGNTLYDFIYINQESLSIIYNDNTSIKKLYMFEIINHYLSLGIKFKSIKINDTDITIINNIKTIEKIRKKSCLI